MAIAKKTTTPVKPAASKTAKVAPKTTCGTSACACSASKPAKATETKKPAATVAPAKKAPTAAQKPAVAPPAAAPAPAKNAPTTKRVTFTIRADPGSLVTIAGSFNNWDSICNPLTDAAGTGTFTTTIPLEPGVYEYKLVLNGTWCVDPNCPDWTQNEFGTLNSVCKV
jgi:hypothetical protein